MWAHVSVCTVTTEKIDYPILKFLEKIRAVFKHTAGYKFIYAQNEYIKKNI